MRENSSATIASEDADGPQAWRIVWASQAVTGVTFGSAYAFSAVFPDLSAEFGASRGEVALVFSIAAFLFYGVGAVAGPLADRSTPRRLILAGLTAMILGLLGASQATSLTMLYLCYGAGAGLGVGLSYVPSVGAVQSWFIAKRSKASGVASAGLALGTLILPFAVGSAVPQIGWRGCFVMLAAVIAAVGLPAAFFIRKRRDAVSANPAARGPYPTPLRLWRIPAFRRYYALMSLASFCTLIPYVHMVPAARDLGLSVEDGAALIGLIGVGSFFGRFILAGMGDRFGPTRMLALLLFAVAGSFLIWASAGGMVSLSVFAVAFGMSYGGCVGLYPAVAVGLFGTRDVGATLGYLYSSVGFAALFGPTLTGFVFDQTGSYLAPILVSAAASVVAGLLTLRLRNDASAFST
jgi:OFA family oxalate/formate antiporter-like MFS transporter